VLDNILGPLHGKNDQQTEGDPSSTDEHVTSTSNEDIDFGGLSLEQFANAPIQPASKKELTISTDAVVEDFEKEKDRFEDLHTSIVSCDEVLGSVETWLLSPPKSRLSRIALPL
jgi:vacuolar protein sorting-associated protein 52